MAEWIVLSGLALWAAAAFHSMRRRKKAGKSLTCGGDCASCPYSCKGK